MTQRQQHQANPLVVSNVPPDLVVRQRHAVRGGQATFWIHDRVTGRDTQGPFPSHMQAVRATQTVMRQFRDRLAQADQATVRIEQAMRQVEQGFENFFDRPALARSIIGIDPAAGPDRSAAVVVSPTGRMNINVGPDFHMVDVGTSLTLSGGHIEGMNLGDDVTITYPDGSVAMGQVCHRYAADSVRVVMRSFVEETNRLHDEANRQAVRNVVFDALDKPLDVPTGKRAVDVRTANQITLSRRVADLERALEDMLLSVGDQRTHIGYEVIKAYVPIWKRDAARKVLEGANADEVYTKASRRDDRGDGGKPRRDVRLSD